MNRLSRGDEGDRGTLEGIGGLLVVPLLVRSPLLYEEGTFLVSNSGTYGAIILRNSCLEGNQGAGEREKG